MAMPVTVWLTMSGAGPYRFVQWDGLSLYHMREINEILSPNTNWTVDMVSYGLTFNKSGVLVGSMAPGDWLLLSEWSDSGSPGITSNSSHQSGYQQFFV